MMKLCKHLMIISAVIIIGFSLIACGDSSLNGTWVAAGEILILKNGSFTIIMDNDMGEIKGKYSTSGTDTITLTFIEVKGKIIEMGMGLPSNQWYTRNSLRKAVIDMVIDITDLSRADAEKAVDEEPQIQSGMNMIFSVLTGTYSEDVIKITVFGQTTEYKLQK